MQRIWFLLHMLINTHCKVLPVWLPVFDFPRRERAAWRSALVSSFFYRDVSCLLEAALAFFKHEIRNRNNKHNQQSFSSHVLCFKLSMGTHMFLFCFCKTHFILQCPKTDLSTPLSNSLYGVKPNSCVQPGSFTEPWNCGE